MFETKNCPKCGRLFVKGKNPYCEECMKKEEETFQIVRDYLKENPKSTIVQITNETGVSAKKINRYLREGRLEITEGMSDFLKCMQCGASIRTGRLCRVCSSKMSKSIKGLKSIEAESPDKTKMHHKSKIT